MSFFGALNAQDAHFSQFYAVPYHINPGLTGAVNGTYRLVADYRDQWGGALESPYTTFVMGGDVNFSIGSGQNESKDRFGLGLLFSSDRVNSVHFNTNEIAIYTAYHKSLNSKGTHFLGAGLKMSVVQRNINYDNLNFGDSFNAIDAFDQPTAELFAPNNFGFLDLSLGINYRVAPKKGTSFMMGAGAHHLAAPNVSFYKNIDNPNPDLVIENKLFRRYVAHFSMDNRINDYWDLQPRVIFQTQGPHQEVNLGTNLKYNFVGLDRSLYFGTWVRTVKSVDGYQLESIIPLVGIQTGSFILGLSYDVNLSETSSGTAGFNSFEISIRFIGEHDNDSAFCPEF